MAKVAIVVLADTETHWDLARVVNALVGVKELKEGGDEVTAIFEGAGTKWIKELANPEHRVHGLYEAVKDKIEGACGFCAAAFGVREAVRQSGVALLDEYERHPSLRK